MTTIPPSVIAGLGCAKASLLLYTPHRPPLTRYQQLQGYQPAMPGECDQIIRETGNHWRKIFSIFAKLAQHLFYPNETWQAVRDTHLLTAGSHTGLVFQNRLVSPLQNATTTLHIIGGQAFAESFEQTWRKPQRVAGNCKLQGSYEEEGAVYRTPYLDYRQFTNAMIADLLPELRAQIGEEFLRLRF